MILLFEEYQYNTEKLKQVLSERYFYPINSNKSKINYVGYYFNSAVNEAVVILPKVFVNEKGLVFEEFDPESLMCQTQQVKDQLKKSGKNKILFEIATWLYRAIQQFNKRRFRNTISENQFLNQIVTNLDEKSNTELDIILSLFRFYNQNKSFFTFISKSAHSQRSKVNWHKTIGKKQPIIQNNTPIYLDLATISKKIDYEDELIVLFYSTLTFIKNKYAFEFFPLQNYQLLLGHQFETILRKGCRHLESIKYKYYSDKMICLYKLLYAYFERSEQTQSKKQIEEILLIRDFNIVFEDMMDDLIGDDNLLPELKNHSDGKQVDHIYKYKSLIIEDDIYFVGDSKYYKPNTNVSKYSQAKQFTYAKNVIQYNIDLFNSNSLSNNLRYRDNATEGYNITPNFFISAFVNNSLDFSNSCLDETGTPIMQSHFNNRLFDRDTLFVQSYNINFLFVLSAYLTNNSTLKSNFRKNTHKKFREKLVSYINSKYHFYILEPRDAGFIEKHFKLLLGKVYKPSHLAAEVILALERPDQSDILVKIENDIVSRKEYFLE